MITVQDGFLKLLYIILITDMCQNGLSFRNCQSALPIRGQFSLLLKTLDSQRISTGGRVLPRHSSSAWRSCTITILQIRIWFHAGLMTEKVKKLPRMAESRPGAGRMQHILKIISLCFRG